MNAMKLRIDLNINMATRGQAFVLKYKEEFR